MGESKGPVGLVQGLESWRCGVDVRSVEFDG